MILSAPTASASIYSDDTADYLDLARAMRDLAVFGVTGTPEIVRTPAYPLFLAAVLTFTGSEVAAVPVQLLLGALAALLAGAKATLVAPPGLSRPAAIGAAAFVMLDPTFSILQ